MEEEQDYDIEEINSTTEPLTDWKNEPTVSQLKKDFETASTAHSLHVADVNKWLDNLFIRGSAKKKKIPNKSNIQPKLIRKQAEWRYAALSEPFLSTDKLFNTEPATHLDVEAAKQNGMILNYQFRNQINKVALIDSYVRTAVNEGTAVFRVGWEYEDEEIDEEIPEMGTVITGYDGAGQAIEEEIQIGTTTEKKITIVKNQPTVEVCDYNNVIIDPTCLGDMSKASFVIYSFETSLSDLKKKGIYKNLDKIKVSNQANVAMGNPDYESYNNTEFSFDDKPRKKLLAYEYWGFWDINKDGMTKPFVATYIGDTMIRMEENPFPDQKLPFVTAPYLPVKNSIYGEPDGELLEENQKIIGAVTRGMIDILGKNAAGQRGISKGLLDFTNKRKYEKGMDFEYNPTQHPQNAIYTQVFPQIPTSAEYMLNNQNADAESLTGVKAFHSGISGQGLGSTATGVRGALDAASKRELGILRRLATALEEVGKKIMSMNTEFLSEEEVIRITDKEFLTVNRENLKGNYDVKISVATAEADNDKAQNLSFMLQTMGNNMPLDITKTILADIAELHKMPALAEKINQYQPQPDPLVQRKSELEVALLEAQIANEQAKAKENQIDQKLKWWKANVEEAKARSINADSDLKDQSFLENDQGIGHLRELEKLDQKSKLDLDAQAASKMLEGAGDSKNKQTDN